MGDWDYDDQAQRVLDAFHGFPSQEAYDKAKAAESEKAVARGRARYEPDLCRCGECIVNRKERRAAARKSKKDAPK